MKNLLILSLACIAGIVSSCEKEDTLPCVPTCEVVKEKIAGTYFHTKWEQKDGSSNYADLSIPPCMLDNTITFNTNGTLINSDLGMKCDKEEETGSWSITNATTLVLDEETYTIESFDCKMLVLSATNTNKDNHTTMRITFTKRNLLY